VIDNTFTPVINLLTTIFTLLHQNSLYPPLFLPFLRPLKKEIETRIKEERDAFLIPEEIVFKHSAKLVNYFFENQSEEGDEVISILIFFSQFDEFS